MNLEALHRKLIAAGRAHRPSQHVPFGFETRILARLPLRPGLDQWALWARALWRAAAPCFGVMLLLSAWSLFDPTAKAPNANNATADLAQEFDNLLLAAANPEQLPDSSW